MHLRTDPPPATLCSQATAASFNAILGISVSPAGAIYVADNGNQRIRIVSTSGVVTTFAGNGAGQYSGDGGQATSASLYDPRGCDTGSDSTTYIADTGARMLVWLSLLALPEPPPPVRLALFQVTT